MVIMITVFVILPKNTNNNIVIVLKKNRRIMTVITIRAAIRLTVSKY